MKNFINNLILLAIILLLPFIGAGQNLSLNAVNPFSRIEVKQNVSVGSKKEFIQAVNKGQRKIMYIGSNQVISNPRVVALTGETKLIAFEVKNLSTKPLSQVNISIKSPAGLSISAYRHGLINDWYSNINKKDNTLNFYGDPLLKLAEQNGSYVLQNLSSKEAVRIVLEIEDKNASSGFLSIQANVGKDIQQLKYNYKIINRRIPKNEFSSIAYNTINLSSSANLTNLLKDVGFTHLQVNPVPKALFNAQGELISNGIDQTAASSKSFRDIANNWVKSGGKLAIYWQSQYNNLAPLSNGGYIPPYTSAWNTAFVNLIKQVVANLKKVSNQFDESQLVIYLADEVNEAALNKKGFSSKTLLETNKVIKAAFPNIKTMVTFGFYSGDVEVNTLYGGVDITMMHAKMPTKSITAGRNYTPFQTKTNYTAKVATGGKSSSWNYNVESGIVSDLRDFWFLPMVAASTGSAGFSWWAFASHRGSTWTINEKNGLNYSMYYANETNNELFKQWTIGLPVQDRFIPSLRLKAAEAGLLNAKIFISVKEKSAQLNAQDRQSFNTLINKLKKIDSSSKENMTFPSVDEIEKVGNDLREIYSRY